MKRELIKKLENSNEVTSEELNMILEALNRNKKYGLVWEDHPEDVELELKDGTFNIEEIREKRIEMNPDGRENLLLEGDNLHSLMMMKEAGMKVEFCYLDPPYNTLNEKGFGYNDKRVDGNDEYRHSKWLSFMDKRLKLARELLTDDGVIFVSIDDNEQANLKLLMDQVFGEENFITQISRATKMGGSKGTNINPNTDYIIVYAKLKSSMLSFNKLVDSDYLNRYKDQDELGLYLLDGFFRPSMQTRPNQRYYIECPDGSHIIPKGNTFPSVVKDGEYVKPEKGEKVWRWSYARYLNSKHDVVVKQTSKPNPNYVNEKGEEPYWNVYKKVRLDMEKSGILQGQIQLGFLNAEGTATMSDVGLDFEFPKPTSLIQWCLKLYPNKNATILDFFAGSGTTGHAVMELNKEDGGNRRFILCTNNENNICEEVTYERNRRVITGEYAKGPVEPLPNNLSYYTVGITNKNHIGFNERKKIDTDNKAKMLLLKDELRISVEKEDYIVLSNKNTKVLMITNKIIDKNIRELDLDNFDTIYTPIITNRDKCFKNIDETKVIYY